MSRRTNAVVAGAIALTLTFAGAASAGPIILGGDDLTDHGSRSGGGANLEGWLYIEKAVSGVVAGQTRPGAITHDIVALGSSDPGAFSSGNAGGAIRSVADVLGFSVLYLDGDVAINAFFADLASGAVNPKMLWIAGTGAANDLDTTEGLALTGNATGIRDFVNSGGGLMSHGSGDTAYGWLTSLLPGLNELSGCNSAGATLTPDGNAAFPGLSNSDIDSNAGPCHSHFTGDLGSLKILALDGDGLSFIIGGGSGARIDPVPAPATLALLGIGIAALALARRRRSA